MIDESDECNGHTRQGKRGLIHNGSITQIPIDEIIIQNAQRNFDPESAADKNLVESVEEFGVLEPTLVQEQEKGYLIVSGERRYHASREAGLKTLPAIVFGRSLSKEDFLMIQMIENLQRENTDPITEAKGYLSYFQMILECPGLEDSIAKLILHGRNSKRLGVESAEKISALETISGKTSRTIQNLINLLRLPPEAQQAIIDNKISLSQGYILSRYTLHHRFTTVLQERLKHEKMTNDDLLALFENGEDDFEKVAKVRRRCLRQLKIIRQDIEKQKTRMQPIESEEFLAEIEVLSKLVKTAGNL